MCAGAATGKAQGMIDHAPDATPLARPILARLPDVAWRLVAAGTGGYDTETRRGLIIANITGYLASVSSLSYALNYALHGWDLLWPLVLGNIASALCTACVPLFHRLGPAAAGVWLSAVIFSSIFYFIAYLGRESGIQLNYLGTGPVALVILGIQRIRLAGTIAAVALACHLAAWYAFPRHEAVVRADTAFMDQIYALTAVSMMGIIFLVVYYALHLARAAQAQTDALIHNIMPDEIAERLKERPGRTIAESYDDASVIFADITGFTPLATSLGPKRIVALLDEIFTAFDAAAERHGIEKIKTIGDAYMAVAGLPAPMPGHAAAAVELACEMIAAARKIGARHGLSLELRVGIASGPVMAGVIGRAKFSYDAWGETVNLAARLQTAGQPGHVHISAATRQQLPEPCRASGPRVIELKGIGAIETCTIDAE
jgi:adenylate cyclase